MKLSDLEYVPAWDLLAPHTLFRIQRSRSRPGTIRTGRVLLPPSHLMLGRFDIDGVPVGYFAESPDTAAYESLCRRETEILSFSVVAKRSLLCVQTKTKLQMLDLRPHAHSWPVLQSLRFTHTQALAKEAHAEGFSGIVYRSAQQHGMDCYALFGEALKTLKTSWSELLTQPRTGHLHHVVATALKGSQLSLAP